MLTKHGQNPVAVARSEGSNQARLVYFIIFYSFIYFAHFFGGYSGRIRGGLENNYVMVSVMESANEKRKIQHLWPGWIARRTDLQLGIKSSTCVR